MASGRSKSPSSSTDPSSSNSSTSGSTARGGKRAEVMAEYQRQQAKSRRNSRLIVAVSILVAVVIVGGAVVAIGLNHDKGASAPTTAAADSVTSAVAGVPASTFDAIGAGTASNFPATLSGGEGSTPPPALTADGKPRVLYVGAEYCPYCAAERWSVTAALSRFGTFKNLGQTTSAHADVYPDTPTLSFHGSSYTSDYLSFTGIEQTTNQPQGNGYAPLDQISAEDEKLVQTYDYPPYVQSQGAIPFIDIGGKYVVSGASYDPGVLKGMTHQQIADAMSDPNSDVAKAIDGAANGFSAALCQLTDNKPAAVCTSPGVTAAASKLG